MEVTRFLDTRTKEKGLTASREKIMIFVNNFFTSVDLGRSNELTVIEFFCALPSFEKLIVTLDGNL